MVVVVGGIDIAAVVVSSIEAEDFLGRVAGKLGIREAALRGELKAVPMPRAAAVVAPEAVQGRAVLTREEQLVGLVYGYSERALTLRERLRGMVLGGVCGELLQAWLDAGDVAGALTRVQPEVRDRVNIWLLEMQEATQLQNDARIEEQMGELMTRIVHDAKEVARAVCRAKIAAAEAVGDGAEAARLLGEYAGMLRG